MGSGLKGDLEQPILENFGLLAHVIRSAFVKGSRTPAVAGPVPRTRSAGVGEASGEETAGGLGAAVRAVRSMGI